MAPVSRKAASQRPSKLGLGAGQSLTVENALYGMVVKSANDAAMCAGEYMGGGSEAAFAERMTRKAHELGMVLDAMSVEELNDRIGLLEAEIARLRAAIEFKQKSKNAAAAAFKF